MIKDKPLACPHCGSTQLIARTENRKIYINHQGERIPLLTAHYSLKMPVIEENTTTYTCNCPWHQSNPEY